MTTEHVQTRHLVPGERILFARRWHKIERITPAPDGWSTLHLVDDFDVHSSLQTTADSTWTVKR